MVFNMANIYGYTRISTKKQSIERQIENIRISYPDAIIFTEEYTGTKMDRPIWNKLFKSVKSGDTIVFDEVSRMSRDAEEGFKTYKELYQRGVNLVFLKESAINTSVYRKSLEKKIDVIVRTGKQSTDKLIQNIIDALNEFMLDVVKEQITQSFDHAQMEVDYLHKRTKEGLAIAKAQGKQIGRVKGAKVETKKSKEMKQKIYKLSKDFEGHNSDAEVMAICGIARNTYYKYKREIRAEQG